MAFTHNRPSARRHTVLENEVKTDGTYTITRLRGGSSSESRSNANVTYKTSYHNDAIHNGLHPVSSQYISEGNTVTNAGDSFASGATQDERVTSIFSHTKDVCSRSTFATGSQSRQDTGTDNVFGNGNSNSASSTFRSFRSYGSSITEQSGQGFASATGSTKRVSRDGDGNSGNYIVRTTLSNSFEFGGTTEKVAAGSVVNMTTTTFRGDTTLFKETGNTGEMPNGNTNDPGVTNDGNQTVTDRTRHEEAVFNMTTPTQIEEIIAETVTTTTEFDFLYKVKSSNLLSTFFSSYPIKTSTTSENGQYATISKDAFTTNRETLTNTPVSEYTKYTVHGAAAFLTGGVRLSNGFVSNPTTASTVIPIALTQPPLDQSVSYQLYVAARDQSNIVGNALTNLTENHNTLGVTSSEGTQIYSDFTDYGHPVNFHDTESRGYVYDSRTFRSNFFGDRTTNIKATTTQTENSGFGGSYTLNGYVPDVQTQNFTRAGSDGIVEATFWSTYYRPGVSTLGHGQQLKGTRNIGNTISLSFLASVGPSSVTRTDEFGIDTRDRGATLISFDKGLEGGIQYETSTDISGAIRGFKNATIAHEYITTTTLSQSSSNISVNTASSESYESICHPILGRTFNRSGFKLNRYATFLPKGFYGNIYTHIKGGGHNSDLGNVEFIHEADGSSIIKYAKNFSYLSTQSFNTGSSATQTATSCAMSSSSHTNLKGLIVIENATDDDNYHRTVLVESEGDRGYFGGFAFTNDNGFIANGGGIPFSFHAFDANNSSVIDVPLTGLGNYSNIVTQTLPANAMIFLNQTTVPFARTNIGLDVVDRFQ